MLTLNDFISDFQYLVASSLGNKHLLELAEKHISEHYKHIEKECIDYVVMYLSIW